MLIANATRRRVHHGSPEVDLMDDEESDLELARWSAYFTWQLDVLNPKSSTARLVTGAAFTVLLPTMLSLVLNTVLINLMVPKCNVDAHCHPGEFCISTNITKGVCRECSRIFKRGFNTSVVDATNLL